MKYYALRGRALSENLRMRFEREDDRAFTRWSVNAGKGKPIAHMPYGATLYLGGRKPDFEDVLNGADGLPVFSERAIEVMQPFLRGPDDIEWLYLPQAPDPKSKYPCERKYALLNPLFFVPPEQAYTITYTEAVDGFDPSISSIKLNKKALNGLHFFAVNFMTRNCFISEPLLRALKAPPLHPLVRCMSEKSALLFMCQAPYNAAVGRKREQELREQG
jgi:hypothetical protein